MCVVGRCAAKIGDKRTCRLPFFDLKFTASHDHAIARTHQNLPLHFDNHISVTMASPKKTPVRKKRIVKQKRRCAVCSQVGHDRRNCPQLPGGAPHRAARMDVIIQNGVEEGPQSPPLIATAVPTISNIDWENVLYVVFDLETTGRSRQRDEIIEVAAQFLDPNGIQLEDGVFDQLVRPNSTIPRFITELTSISNEDVSSSEQFRSVAEAFIQFMCRRADEYSTENNQPVEHIILVAHNGKAFDIPFFIQQLSRNDMVGLLFGDGRFGFSIDTLQLARKGILNNPASSVPTAYNLPQLFQFISGSPPPVSHRASADVKATTYVFRHPIFWETRQQCIFSFRTPANLAPILQPTAATTNLDDSDTSLDDNSTSDNSTAEDPTEETPSIMTAAGDAWERNMDYRPSVPLPMAKFQEHFTSTGRSRRQRIGLQCNPIDVNTPIRAWREIFKYTLLEKIVKYTNDYGCHHAKHWQDITRKDLEAFIAVLFVSAVQKRKDKPSNWFSENRLLENPIVKKIMSGRKFFLILRYLHCCSMEPPPTGDDYDPAYKIAEVRDYLEDRYSRLFIPGQQLSLDETLIRAFGRIKFKVRIVTKAARYGIKLYVITDATTAYVLKIVIYTGKSTYGSTDEMDKLKTVQVVERLVEPFIGTHRTIYVDRFYTSVELLKSLEARDLYVTGTMLANRIPLAIRIAKTSPTFRNMARGDAFKCRLRFQTAEGGTSHAGLVCWRDRNMVYCLSNDTNNFEFDECSRRGNGGIIRIPRPLSIANYNKYMGGVDLADMRRLHCNSTIMCQNRWWLKLFFYLLDVGTSNALVLYNESCKIRLDESVYSPMNIVDFKMHVIQGLVGRNIEDLVVVPEAEVEHRATHIDGGVRLRCAYCALMSRQRRTRYQCRGCGVPLCSIGNGKVSDDCFTQAHASEERQEMVWAKYQAMQKSTTNKNKNLT